MINFRTLGDMYMKKYMPMTDVQKHRALQLFLEGAKYRLGTENLFSTDCSGVLSWPLLCMGYDIRITADGFYKTLYIHDYDAGHTWRDETLAVFYLMNGKASHVSAVVGRNVLLDAWDEDHLAELKDMDTTVKWYRENGYEVKLRGLDWAAVKSSGRLSYDVDDIIYGLHTQ